MVLDKKLLKLDVTNKTQLKKYGFDKSQYYCGMYIHQKFLSKIKNYLEKLGVVFPFNEACFKHDLNYSCELNIFEKTVVDAIFLLDMVTLLEKSKLPKDIKEKLKKRILRYYFIVSLFTPIYILMGIIKIKWTQMIL